MSWSNDVPLVSISFGRGKGTNGEVASTQMTVTPLFVDSTGNTNTRYLVWTATGDVFIPTQEVYSGQQGLPMTIQIPAVDRPGWVDEFGNPYTGWLYEFNAQYSISGSGGGTLSSIKRKFGPTLAQSPINYDTLGNFGE